LDGKLRRPIDFAVRTRPPPRMLAVQHVDELGVVAPGTLDPVSGYW